MKTMRVPEELKGRLEQYVSKNAMTVELITEGEASVVVERCSDRTESTLSTLRTGGWIACETALALAGRLEVDSLHVGEMMDLLDIKIRKCGLGCFE